MNEKRMLCLSTMVVLTATLLLAAAALFPALAQTPGPDGTGAPQASGGPDGFGYTFVDSNEPGGPVYAWEEISGSGALVTGWTSMDDGYAGPIPLGFSIDYYGSSYDELFVGTNGFVSFGQGYGTIPGASPPSTSYPNNDIALFGSDLYLYSYGSESAIYYQTLTNPTRFVLEFVDIHYCCGGNTPHTFELIVYPSGDLVVQYSALNGTSTNYVGIENASGTDGLGYGTTLADGLAIRYSYPVGVFLTPAEQQGFGKPGDTLTYTLWIVNKTGVTDSFDVSLQPGSVWATTLGLTQTGSLAAGESVPFDVWVEVPAAAQPGDVDVATIQATLAASPTVYLDTSTLTTYSRGDVVYVSLSSSDLVVMVDAATLQILDTIPVGVAGCDGPGRLAMTPDGKQVWVGCTYSNNVAVIDTGSNTVVRNVAGIPYAEGIAFTRDGGYALVGSSSYAQIAIIDTSNFFFTFLPTPSTARSVATHPYFDLAYATCNNGTLLVIDTSTFTIDTSIPVVTSPWDVAVSTDGRWVFTGDYSGGGLAVVDAQTNMLHTTVTGLGNLTGLEVAPDGLQIYACARWEGVHILDGKSFQLLNTVDTSGESSEAGVTCDGSRLFVADLNDRVPAINTTTQSLIGEIVVPGYSTRGVAACPQQVAEGVHLSPPAQVNQGARGEVVEHQVQLVNLTGATDSFTLTLGSYAWDSALSTALIGPLDNGEWAVFKVDVTVPAAAEWYATDTVVVTATSVASPTGLVETASATTEAFAPPQIGVSPASLSSTQLVNEITMQTMTIGNGNGVTLTFAIEDLERTPGQVRVAPLDLPMATQRSTFGWKGEGGAGDDRSTVVAPAPTLPVARVLAAGVESSPEILAGQYYTTTEDNEDNAHSGNPDGDMDVNVCGSGYVEPIEFNIMVDHAFNATGHALTIRAYDVDSPSEIDEVWLNGVYLGDLSGVDGTWSETTFSVPPGGIVQGANLVEVDITSPDWCATVDWGELFVVSAPAAWLAESPDSGSVPSDSNQAIAVTFDATDRQPGTYLAEILVASNDPVLPLVSLPVTMAVLPTADMGWVEGTVTDQDGGAPLEAVVEAPGQPYEVHTDPATGYYKLWLVEGSYTVRASASGYVSGTATVEIVAGQGTAQDWALVLNVPVLQVTGPSLEASQEVGQVTVHTLTVANLGPAEMYVELHTGGDDGFMLESVLEDLNENFQPLVDAIPDRYEFSGGESGYSINDGGDDMYDGGNYLSTDLGGSIAYSDNVIVDSTLFGAAGRYFTRKYPGLFVLAAEMEGVGFFQISGDLGADGSGTVDGTVLQTVHYGVTYYGFVKRVYGAGDPSVNHLIIVAGVPGATQSYPTYTGNDAHMVLGLQGATRLYYLLYAGSEGAYIDDGATQNIMDTFLVAAGVVPPLLWLSAEPVSATVPGYSSLPVEVTMDATGLQPGEYRAALDIDSNDPVQPSASRPVTMTVLPTADMGSVAGQVTHAWTRQPLTATVELMGVYSTVVRPDFEIWATAGSYSLRVYAKGYYTVTVPVTIMAGEVTVADVALEPLQPRLGSWPLFLKPIVMQGRVGMKEFMLPNIGPLPLEVTLREINPEQALRAPSAIDLAGKKILYDRAHGEPDVTNYGTLVSDLIAAGAIITQNWTYPVDALVLEGYDVLWVTCCGYESWLYGELTAIDAWLDGGGAVLVQGESSASTSGPANVLGISYRSGSCSSGSTDGISPHPISEGVERVYVDWTCYWLAAGSGATAVVLDGYGQPHVVAQEESGGKMVVIASEDLTNSAIGYDDNRRLGNNIMAWLARPAYGDVPWLSASPGSTMIPGHESVQVLVEFDALALALGKYEAILAIEHNDPDVSNPIEIPITLSVVDAYRVYVPIVFRNW
ncbi:MAG: carboxypeptidase regulatory-like domain-containing protein [Anaerolineae bacterium]|nr:carboxypeptidase regulatory-like domain-containing protein [Anaerolineae bacterium]